MNVVPTDSASIFAALNTLVLNEATLAIVRPNNPPRGIAGFIMDVVNDDGVELESDIPDHYVEENIPVQDQIALRPEVITVSGEVAEVVRMATTAERTTPQPNPLPNVSVLSPQLTPGALAQYNLRTSVLNNTKSAITSDASLYGYYLSHLAQQPNATKQSKVFGYFYQLWKGRQRFSVETPWGIFTNMAILSLSAKQGPESRFVSEFSITFKKIRTVSSQTVQVGHLAGRSIFQQAGVTQNGTVGQLSLSTAQMNQFNQRTTPPVSP
jgi:hypothetical protein